MPKTIIVSNRLPVKIKVEKNEFKTRPSEGGLATGLGSIYKKGNNIWLGWPGQPIKKESDKAKITAQLKKDNMAPVFLTQTEIEEFYEGFSNETLWPNFHYFNQFAVYNTGLWKAYQKVNRKFAKEIAKIASPNDTIWIHDYQLLLVPQMVREMFPRISIGFFLHIPFPSFESFRLLPWRRELLLGMLGSDFLGFHTYDDMRHFLSSVNRLAGFGNSNGKMTVNNRIVMADALPMGIDYDKYASEASHPDTLTKEVKFRASLGDVKLVLSIDRLDYSKGIPQRLRAFEMFLERYPEWRDKVSVVMIVVPSRDQVEMYKQLKEEIDLLVGRINGKFSRLAWTPIHYFYRSFELSSLSAFYRMAHVALVTPMRDGMNLVCKEFIASKLDKKGVLILSEMAGASKELSDSILINPNDMEEQVEAIHQALTMPEAEQITRMTSMQESLKRYNIHHWVNLFFDRLGLVKAEQQSLETKLVDKETSQKLLKDYKKASTRLIFLDYDGTLTGFSDNPQHAIPDAELHSIVKLLTANKKNRVVIISGRDRQTLEGWLGRYPVDFITEHGAWLREIGSEWETIAAMDASWKRNIMEVMEGYVNRTPGSFVEEKEFSLVWHYRKVETGLGELRTRELTSHLKYITANMPLNVLEGNKVVEVKNSEINKGRAATLWLEKFPSDFVLAVGDDWTDEDTFKSMPEKAYSIKVGSTYSAAKFNIPSVEDVRKLLKQLGDIG
ncbi:bifunctional alpha,alpha-trehalose-phosphate synthase (UDP-forming)/trehalose-phosphatase [uncultured Imperialibacter sp.]|uniref:bifunctional alpha,alpha-trehalose-phosphate synthase (UDP-forming)/trehalose-phosphatase n=1 Tax=uncultured Imperialibacter sp. TaxID=1672639 RepID=UPI0030D6E3FC|tara:strand:+ start:91617 stop:93797 length:2181 start_codon:yes stop_codon:yes gene_type:complete